MGAVYLNHKPRAPSTGNDLSAGALQQEQKEPFQIIQCPICAGMGWYYTAGLRLTCTLCEGKKRVRMFPNGSLTPLQEGM